MPTATEPEVMEVLSEAPRAEVLKALSEPGSRARNERGALSITKFKTIGKLRWAVNGAAGSKMGRDHSEL